MKERTMVKVATDWDDYEIIATGDGEKLERWGKLILLRPDPQVIWHAKFPLKSYKGINAVYRRSEKGGGAWSNNANASFEVERKGLRFSLKLMGFKHTGLFPEQAVNWEWFSSIIKEALNNNPSRTIKVLNLFAYTGGATLSAAAAGAQVTHVDASKGMVGWAKENAASSGLAKAPVRWLVDDCVKFVEREIRRGSTYDAVIMDPPSYGRGPKGEIWKIEDAVYPFIELTTKVLAKNPLFFLINSYTTGLQPAVLSYMLETALVAKFGGVVQSSEIGLPVSSNGLVLPCGASGRWTAKSE